MQHSTSTQESIVVLRRENEAKILKFLQKCVGPPPAASLCSKHPLKSKKLCTSQSDAHLTNAGRWFSFCKPCDKLYFSNRTIHIGDLIVSNGEFRALIERRRALSPKARPSQKRERATLAPPMGNRPVVKAFILWTESGKSPTLISFFCESTKPIRLVDYRKTLEENGVRYGRAVEVFDTSKKAWVYLGWSAEYLCGERQDVLLRYYGLDKVTNFGMFFS